MLLLLLFIVIIWFLNNPKQVCIALFNGEVTINSILNVLQNDILFNWLYNVFTCVSPYFDIFESLIFGSNPFIQNVGENQVDAVRTVSLYSDCACLMQYNVFSTLSNLDTFPNPSPPVEFPDGIFGANWISDVCPEDFEQQQHRQYSPHWAKLSLFNDIQEIQSQNLTY